MINFLKVLLITSLLIVTMPVLDYAIFNALLYVLQPIPAELLGHLCAITYGALVLKVTLFNGIKK